MRAMVYNRISDDRRGLGLGVLRQQEDCCALVERHRWTLAGTLTDNDISAYSGKPRPGYKTLLAAIAAGLVDVVVAWHPDRLHRSPAELEHFIPLLERHGVRVETVTAGEWDLSTPSGRLTARQLGAVARYESEHKAERTRRALQQRAESGAPHGRRAFGWVRVYDDASGRPRQVVEPAEAEALRDMAKQVLAGTSLASIAAAADASGIRPPGGARWTASAVRGVLLRESNVGRLVRHGEVVGVGDWEPLLDEDTFDQVVAVLRDPARRTATATAAKHLLSGLARCGVCGGRMRSSTAGGKRQYKCERSCLARSLARVDELVEGVVCGLLARDDVADVFVPDRSREVRAAAQDAATLQDRLDSAADAYAEGRITARQLDRITSRLRPQLDAAQAKTRVVSGVDVLDGIAGRPDVEAVWASLPLSRRRAIVDLLMTVTIDPTSKGKRFDPSHVRIEWKGQA